MFCPMFQRCSYRSQWPAGRGSCGTISRLFDRPYLPANTPSLLPSKALEDDFGIFVYAEVLCCCGIC